jgi:hypothetical protein
VTGSLRSMTKDRRLLARSYFNIKSPYAVFTASHLGDFDFVV